MWRGECITGWGWSAAGAHKALVALDYPSIMQEDVTRQLVGSLQPDPNMMIVYFECDAATLDAIEADSDYHVLWSEEIDAEI